MFYSVYSIVVWASCLESLKCKTSVLHLHFQYPGTVFYSVNSMVFSLDLLLSCSLFVTTTVPRSEPSNGGDLGARVGGSASGISLTHPVTCYSVCTLLYQVYSIQQ